MSLDIVRRTFEKLGREDPLYGVLTDHARRYNKWDPVEFFATGATEVGEVVATCNGNPVQTGVSMLSGSIKELELAARSGTSRRVRPA